MTTATQSEAARQKAEAESFLRRVQVEHPHLLVLGYQAILNATVLGMKELEIYNDNLTEAKFMAGLQHAMTTGVLPKPPVQVVEVAAQPTPEQLEQDRLAKEDAERTRKANAERFKSPRHNHAHDVEPSKKNESKLNELRAKERCESVTGRTHAETEQIRKLFVMKPGSSEIDWAATEHARLRIAKGNLRTVDYRY
jgi:hypothetical protein